MTEVRSEHVIESLLRQLKDAHMRIAVLEAQIAQATEDMNALSGAVAVPADVE